MKLTERQAEDRARAVSPLGFLRPCNEVPFGLYGVDLETDFLFAVDHPNRIGGTEYIAVSRSTGVARVAGVVGE